MQFLSIGTIHNSIQNMKLEMRWQKRKDNPYMAKGPEEDPQITDLKRQAADVRKSNMITNLDGKLKSGGVLTDDEMQYLKENSPELYQKAVEVRKEREEYKKQLQRCRTKEEVERLNANKLQNFIAQAGAISSNANIPKNTKLGLMDQICRKVMGIHSEHQIFLQSKEYAALPSEEELEEKKAREKKKTDAQQEELQDVDLKQPGEPSAEDLFGQLQKELEQSATSDDPTQAQPEDQRSDGTYDPSRPIHAPAAISAPNASQEQGTVPRSGNADSGSICYNSGGKTTTIQASSSTASPPLLSEKA